MPSPPSTRNPALITVASLKNYSLKDLAQLARKSGIDGWHSMRKEELIRALGKTGKQEKTAKPAGTAKPVNSAKTASSAKPANSAKPAPAVARGKGSVKAGSTKKPLEPKSAVAKSRDTKTADQKTTDTKMANVKSAKAKPAGGKATPQKATNKTVASHGGSAAASAAKGASGGSGVKSSKPALKSGASSSPGGTKAAGKTEPEKPVASKSIAALGATGKSGASRESTKNALGKAPDKGRAAEKSSSANHTSKAAARTSGKSSAKAAPKAVEKPRNTQVARRIQRVNEERERRRDLSQPPEGAGGGKDAEAVRDRVVLIVRDPYWLQATWEVTRQSVQRAHAAMAEQWHTARPILRLMEIENTGTTSSAERLLREIPIHGGVHNWYIDVIDPPKGYRVELGYLGANGKFFGITRSNTVTTPRPGSADSIDENWSDVEENFERIFAQSGGYSEETSSHELQEAIEERLQRPIGPPLSSRFGVGAERILRRRRDFQFDVDAEMVVHGQTKPDAHVTLSGEPVKLREDGSFAVRMALPDKRQVIPVVASSRDGGEQRTIVIAVERNTKVMEPMIRESND